MYTTMWIDILSGKENETFEAVRDRMAKFKEDKGLNYAEIGMVFEEFDIFAIFEFQDTEILVDWILEEIAPLEGVIEIKLGNMCKVNKPLAPLESKPFTIRKMSNGDDPVFTKAKGHSFFITYLDALPARYPQIYKDLVALNDPHIRYFAYCLDSYEEDIIVCLVMEDLEQAKMHIVDTLRNIEGMWDTRTYVVNNVEFL